jgi:acyl-CoA reductase-like NAD-dependent aldehyde dehydrogenase
MFLSAPEPMPATTFEDIDAALARLDSKKEAWRAVSIPERITLLEECIRATVAIAEAWADIGARIKGVAPDHELAGEEWLAGIMPTVRNARLLIRSLREGGAPKPVATRIAPDGRTVARVFPSSPFERLMFMGATADVWIERGLPASQGAIYRGEGGPASGGGRVCCILGGGNVSSIPAMDALYKLFVEDEVVLLKMNPVNEALGPILAKAFAPLVKQGVLEIIYGGAGVGEYAVKHRLVGACHITGSDRTYNAIVWGENARGTTRAVDKPFSAELGCVTPVIVVPGPWSKSDIDFQARHVASMITQNASFNCNAAKVIIVAREWLQKDAFFEAVKEALSRTPPRKAYYPGAAERWSAFKKQYPDAAVVGTEVDGAVPWTVIERLDGNDYALTNEAFCGVVAEVQLDAPDYVGAHPGRFLERAAMFANEKCWGTLSCAVLIHPHTEEAHPEAFAHAIRDLRYGGIGINAFPGAIYALGSPTWGAFPGHNPWNIGSGMGVVHNAWMFDHPEKSVLRMPFRIRPKPAWFSDHRNLVDLGRKLVDHEANPSWSTFLKVVAAALRG